MGRVNQILFVIICFLIVLNTKGIGQEVVYKYVDIKNITSLNQKIDSLSIVENSFELLCDEKPLDRSNYTLFPWSSTLVITSEVKCKNIRAKYITYQFDFSKAYTHKEFEKIATPSAIKDPFKYQLGQPEKKKRLSSLYKSGSISRSIGMGNKQDVGVQSSLNLQLEGKLSDNLNIRAAITDQNIPVQPDGNTTQIQDFDNIFIELYNKKHDLIAGDYYTENSEPYFLKYNKKAQGLHYRYNNQKNVKLGLAAGASRGKFSRQTITQIEGKQGPYRLIGSESESFIVVLSGTEKVYIDGQLLTRGQNRDYIIDYNTAQITFTPNILITKDKRIIVEFQYTDQSYARLLTAFNVEHKIDSFSYAVDYFLETDLKNQEINAGLTDAQKLFLASQGDQIQSAVFLSEDSVGYSEERVLYEKIDSLGYSGVYKYSTNPQKAVYSVRFSEVGEAQGMYNKVNSAANGNVFEWVKPDTIGGMVIKKGRFEPLVLLRSPKQNQMAHFQAKQSHKKGWIECQGALSNQNINTLSQNDKANDFGTALKASASQKLLERKNALLFNYAYEFNHKNFRHIQWFREPEFLRNWNITQQNTQSELHHHVAQLAYLDTLKQNISTYSLNHLSLGALNYKGFQNNITQRFSKKSLKLQALSGWVSSRSTLENTNFLRHQSTLENIFSNTLSVGLRSDLEHNIKAATQTDSLMPNAYSFTDLKPYFLYQDSSGNQLQIGYIYRSDRHIKSNVLSPLSKAHSFEIASKIRQQKNLKLALTSTFRDLSIQDKDANLTPQKTLLNRLESSFRDKKSAMNAQFFYELGSGFETQKEFIYVQVAPGTGNYTWVDYDSSNTAELSEFEVAVFSDQANYIKVLRDVNAFVQTKNNRLNLSLAVLPQKWISNTKNNIIKRVSTTSNFSMDWKTTEENLWQSSNPFLINTNDTQVVGYVSSIRNSVFFNQSSRVYSLTYNQSSAENKFLANNGFEQKHASSHQLVSRFSKFKKWIFEHTYTRGIKEQVNLFFTQRNYQINRSEQAFKISHRANKYNRVIVDFLWTKNQNKPDLGGQISTQLNGGITYRYSKARSIHIESKASVAFVQFSNTLGQTLNNNSPIAFEMLSGLQVGRNYLWNLNIQRTLKKKTQVNILYNGRLSEKTSAVHSLTAEVRVFF